MLPFVQIALPFPVSFPAGGIILIQQSPNLQFPSGIEVIIQLLMNWKTPGHFSLDDPQQSGEMVPEPLLYP